MAIRRATEDLDLAKTSDVIVSSKYTPSLLPGELLERLFVERHGVLHEIMERINRACTSDDRTHTLIVGPRGSGKTHLVALVAHRLHQAIANGLAAQLAWLPEDLWTIDSFESLLQTVADELGIPTSSPEELNETISRSAVEHGLIVVVTENLDETLSSLGEIGQQSLRRLLMSRAVLMVATTTTLSRDLSDQARPFYGFFTSTELEPFDVEVAAEMLAKLASVADDTELVRYLATPVAKARLGVVGHLAGGAPRMWAMLASALTVNQLDQLVELLVSRFDDLTPYYQERLSKLPVQQRKVVAQLAELDRAASVKELAINLGLAERSVGKAVSDLHGRGWIQPIASPLVELVDRRRTYYELAEPMARLAFQIKAARGRPIRLLVEFLKAWFDRSALESAATTASAAQTYAREALASFDGDQWHSAAMRLSGLPTSRVSIVEVLKEVDDALAALADGDATQVLALPNAVRRVIEGRLVSLARESVVDLRQLVHAEARREFGQVPDPTMESWIDNATSLATTHPAEVALWLARAWRFEEAELAVSHMLSALGERHPATLTARANLASSYWSAGRTNDAITLLEQVLADRVEVLGERHPDTLTVRANLASSYWSAGRTNDAITLQEQVLADSVEVLGERHPDTLTARANLASSYWSAGRTNDAITLDEQVLADRVEVLGERHPDTLTARANLASSYRSAGRTNDAITLEEQVLADRVEVLGERHPDTLTARANLASSYRSAGRTNDAITLQEQVLADRVEVLGERHPDTLTARANLASSYRSAGRTNDAITLEEQVLADRVEVLGERHPDTLTARANLASSYRSAGRTNDAITLQEQVLADRVEVLGERHPDTLTARANLASSYWSAGRTNDAITLQEQVLADSVEVLGERHPATLTARANLASSYRSAGRTNDAITLQEQVLADRVEVLGERHPDTLTARANLASSYRSAGRTNDAITLEEQVLADRVEVLGERHPDTLTARANLASSYRSAGRTNDAITLQEQVLADRVEVLGERHPDTLTARANLASSYRSAGRTNDAITLEEQVLADSVEVLGERHPATLTARANLASSYRSAGRTNDAITLEEQVLADRVEVLGERHPDTLTVRANLASSYWSAGRTNDAITLQEQVLADRVEVLGERHPDTLTARANLASSYWSAGRTNDAITLLEQATNEALSSGGGHRHLDAWTQTLERWRENLPPGAEASSQH